MTLLTPARFVAVLAASTLLLTGLTGCFLLPVERPTAAQSSEQPDESDASGTAVGDCWEGDFIDYAQWAAWEGDDAVDCDDDHNSYTFFVGEAEVDSDWDDVETTQAAYAICEPEFESEFEAPDVDRRLMLFYFVADEDAWDDGDRSVRCDVGVSDEGSNYTSPELANLPDIDDVRDNLADGDYELCLTADGYGPYDSVEAEITDCADDDYFWRLDSYEEFEAAEDAAYPSEEALDEFASQSCDPDHARAPEESFYYLPTEPEWTNGYRMIECWFSTVGAIDVPETPEVPGNVL